MSIPGLGGGGGGGNKNVTQTTYTREAPDIEARRLQLMDTAAKLASEGKKKTAGDITIPTQGVAGLTPLQQQAFTNVAGGLGSFQPYLNQAAQNVLGSTAAYDPNAYKAYMNPFQSEVIGGIESQFDKMQNQANLSAAQAGAFGTERQGIQTAELARQRAEAVGQAQAQNYGQAQQMAQQQFESQMGRQQQAGQQLAGLGQYQQQLQQGDVAGLMAAGATQQQQAQQIMDAQYRQQLQQIYEPYQRMAFVSDIYQGAPSSGMAISQGTAPTTNPLAQGIGAGLTGLAAYQGFQNMG
tara:strand:- start:2114 stop:3001 length:888 start_codon:yes stop_codon:yes gene_type:complete